MELSLLLEHRIHQRTCNPRLQGGVKYERKMDLHAKRVDSLPDALLELSVLHFECMQLFAKNQRGSRVEERGGGTCCHSICDFIISMD